MRLTQIDFERDIIGKIVEIGIRAVDKYPPEDLLDDKKKRIFLSHLISIKDKSLKINNRKYLEAEKQVALTFFQEGKGEAVDFFWKEVKKQNLPIEKVDKLSKILKKNNISTLNEYDYINESIVTLRRDNIITDEEQIHLNKLLGDFEEKRNKRK
jgi:hypothetical protein